MLGSIVWDFVLNVIPETCSEDSSMQIYIFYVGKDFSHISWGLESSYPISTLPEHLHSTSLSHAETT